MKGYPQITLMALKILSLHPFSNTYKFASEGISSYSMITVHPSWIKNAHHNLWKWEWLWNGTSNHWISIFKLINTFLLLLPFLNHYDFNKITFNFILHHFKLSIFLGFDLTGRTAKFLHFPRSFLYILSMNTLKSTWEGTS